MKAREKKIMILTFYRITTGSLKGIHTARAQHNRINKIVESSTKHYETIIRDLINFIAKEDFDNILVAGYINEIKY